MYYQNIVTGTFGHTIDEVRRATPNASIPEYTLEVGDFRAYREQTIPAFGWNQNVSEVTPINGKQVWVITPASDQEITQRVASKAMEVRSERDRLLAECDWTQLQDSNLSDPDRATWTAYRQSLRSITDQQGFPWSIIWPVTP